MELLAIASGLAAALSWGAGDFAGGLASRRAAAVRVLLASQALGMAALIVLGLARGEAPPPPRDLLLGALAGLSGGTGLLLLYLSLARGKMGVAAPLTAVAAGGIPLAVGAVTQGLPGPAQMLGFALALVAIWTISRPDQGGVFRPGDLALPLLAGVGLGGFLTIIGLVSAEAAFLWPLVAARVANVALFSGLVAVASLRARRAVWVGGPAPALPAAGAIPWGLAAVAGVGDIAGNLFFALSSQTGRLDVAAVLGSLYPAVTVLLARLVLDERLSRRQGIGVGLALAAVALIAT